MKRSILLGLAAAAALATTPSFAAAATENWEQASRAYAAYAFSGVENWEQAARAYAAYAFGNPVAPASPAGVDAIATGSVGENFSYYVPFANGIGDPSGLTSPHYADDTETGSIGGEQPRVDVEAFCEGEGKMLAERLYIGFCHLGR